MLSNGNIHVGTSAEGPVYLLPEMANRHGLIAGATGTGKTVTLQVLAEGFSQLGVPVFLADVKGDLAGLCAPGENSAKIEKRLGQCGVERFPFRGCPVTFWDVYGEGGHPVRTTVSEMGPLLLSRMLGLNDTQTGVMHILFRIADAEGMLLLDLKDVKAMLAYVGENAAQYTLNYGNISRATVGAIQRAVAILEDQGGDRFFGEPALDLSDWLTLDENGQGTVNILAADRLFLRPVMYSTFLLWLLGALYEYLPERGDEDKPRLVFFFDEAHLLFDDCSKALLERIEQTIRLIRSKGVGVYFVTQSPADVPASVLAQLSGRVQHALRAFTPQEQKLLRSVAQTFRPNPAFDTERALKELGTGEALLSFLQSDGSPAPVQRAIILPPQSRIGAISPDLRRALMDADPIGGAYDACVDRISAYEILSGQYQQAGVPQTQVMQATYAPVTFRVYNAETGEYEEKPIPTLSQFAAPAQTEYPVPVQAEISAPAPAPASPAQKPAKKPAKKRSEMTKGEQLVDSFINSTVSSVGRELGRDFTRSLLGVLGLDAGRRRRK